MNKKTSKKDNQFGEVTIVGSTDEATKSPVVDLPQRNKPTMSFDAWWMLAQSTHKLAPHLKDAVYKHFKSRGYLASKNYDQGLTDFGC